MRNSKSTLKYSKDLKVTDLNVFTEEINKIASTLNNDKRIQSTDLIETYAYRKSKGIVIEKEEIKCSNVIKW